MTKERDDDRFSDDERRALAAWRAAEPPADLARRLVAQGTAPRAGAGSTGDEARARRRRRRRWAAAALAALGLGGGGLAVGMATAQASSAALMSVYLGCLVFGGILLVASMVGGHGEDVGHDTGHEVDHGAHDGGPEGHDHGHHGTGRLPGYLPLLSIRFWVFALTFFGLTGALLQGLRLTPPVIAALIALVVGLLAGYVAARVFQALMRDTVGELQGAEGHVGREGRLLLPVARGQQGKVRFAAQGGQIDLVAETDGAEALAAGTTVLIVGMRGAVAVVERSVPSKEETQS
jgi:membrane protein implicated in regulation of membrane protease activity